MGLLYAVHSQREILKIEKTKRKGLERGGPPGSQGIKKKKNSTLSSQIVPSGRGGKGGEATQRARSHATAYRRENVKRGGAGNIGR